MKFLVDVNASDPVIQWLRELGHDVAHVSERDFRMKDDDILRWAVEEQRIILTTDQDFEELIWRQNKAHCGVLRLENLPRVARRALLEDTLTHYSHELAAGAIVIALSRKTCIRRPLRVSNSEE